MTLVVGGEVDVEGDRHGCCCEHVVDSLRAMPAASEERRAAARDKYYSCPHRRLSPLEEFLMEGSDDGQEA